MMINWSRVVSAVATPEGLLVVEASDSTLGATPQLVPYALGANLAPGPSRRQRMRDLWDEHVALTRMVIVEFFAGHPGLDATMQRLLANQDAIGRLAGSPELARLLREHIQGAAKLLGAVKGGGDVAAQKNFWYANGEQIAQLLAAAWKCPTCAKATVLANMRENMKTHLDTTLAEASAEFKGDWVGSLRAYDAAREHVLYMAEKISDGLGD